LVPSFEIVDDTPLNLKFGPVASGSGLAQAMARNGKIAVVVSSGGINVLERMADDTWTVQAVLGGTADRLAISENGYTFAASNTGTEGYVTVYRKSGSTWVSMGDVIGSDSATLCSEIDGSTEYGVGLSLSADGCTLAVGAPNYNVGIVDEGHTYHRGAVWIFTRTKDTWIEVAKIVPPDFTPWASGDVFSYIGQQVDLSSDGNSVVFSGFRDNEDRGSVWVYVRNSSGTWEHQTKISGLPDAWFGGGLSLCSDDVRMMCLL
jgi:hypothetical protein